RGLQIIRGCEMWPAARHPDFSPSTTKNTITVDHKREQRHIKLKLRTDGSFLCPDCSSKEPMQQLAGDYAKNITVRCRNIACINNTQISVPLCGPDRNDYAPTTSASRGEPNSTAVNELPIWDDHYIAL